MPLNTVMQLSRDDIARVCPDAEIYAELLVLDDRDIVELGCGAAAHTRAIATRWPRCRVTAFEVDKVQHARNLAVSDLPNVRFRYGGAEAIACENATVDVVLMFKSLHHVPLTELAGALAEIRRILRPGGFAYIAEPIFAGAFNEIIRLFHDEERVRAAAFDALRRAVAAGRFELAAEVFFLAPTQFCDFAEFEARIIRATHTEHHLGPEVYAEVRARFARHATPAGARFEVPMRVDLLRKPPA